MTINPKTPDELDALITDWFENEKNPDPMILPGLSESLYRSARGENVSALKPLAESPKKYRWNALNPKARTADMIFGTIIHAMLLEPLTVSELIVTRPAEWKDWRTKAAQEWRDSQEALVVTDESYAEMRECALEVRIHPKAGWIISRAQKEVAVWRRHERTGLILKARLDLPFEDLEGLTAVADIKKCQSVKKSMFEKTITDRLYHVQLAYYADMIGASSAYFVAVEGVAPYEVDIFKLSNKSLRDGRELYEALLDRLVKCRATNRWPGVGEDSDVIEEVSAKPWACTAEGIN